jgi:hypothetical protein
MGFLGFISIFFYLNYYLSWIKKPVDLRHWEMECPRQIQIASFCAVLSFVSLNVMLWSAYSYGTPILVFLWLMGSVALIGLF